jgi:hypothetical protein
LEQQQKGEEDNGNHSNSQQDGNELREMKLKMAALEVHQYIQPIFHKLRNFIYLFQSNALLEAKVEKQEELNAKLAEELQKVKEENKALGKKLEETEQKAQMAKNEVKNMTRKLVQ